MKLEGAIWDETKYYLLAPPLSNLSRVIKTFYFQSAYALSAVYLA